MRRVMPDRTSVPYDCGRQVLVSELTHSGMSPLRALVGEELRLEVLSKYGVMDSAPEADFDDIVRIAAQFCGVPIALVSLLDSERQWFKAKVGVNVDQTPRTGSICNHAIRDSELYVVPDVAENQSLRGNIFPEEPPIRFYAASPLITPEGTALGTLCIMDFEPRQPTADQLELLRVLGKQVMSQLELRRQKSELARRENLLFTILQSEPEGVVLLDSDGSFRMLNPAALSLFDATSVAELQGRSMSEFVAIRDRDVFNTAVALVFGGESTTIPLGIVGQQGTRKWINLHAAPLFDHARRVIEFVGIARDVTERKITRDERDKLMLMIERMPELVAIADLEGRVSFMNAGGREMIGLGLDDELGTLHLTDYVPEHWRGFFRDTVLPTVIENDMWSGQMQLVHLRTGQLIDVQRTMFLIRDSAGAPRFFGSILRDISARVRAEKQSHDSDARYRSLFEHAPDGIIIADANGTYTDVNASLCEMLGYSRDELIGQNATTIAAPDEHANIESAMHTIRTSNEYQRTWRFKRKDETVFPAEVIATTMPDGNILAMLRDITERKRIDDRLRRLIESNVQGVMFWNGQGQITEANDAFLSLTGYSRDDLVNGEVLWLSMTPPEYADADRRASEQTTAGGTFTPYEKEFFRKDGSRVPILIGGARFIDSRDEGVCFVLDLSERKKLEQQYLRAQRMESIGTLAGGIAHDLNNVLGPIVMAVDLLKLKFVDADSEELLELVKAAALRGGDMVRQVLSFARGVEGRRMEVQMRHLVRDIEKIIVESLPKSIDIRMKIGTELWTVIGDPTQLHQVLMNLCVNARDAMPTGGCLTISAENHPLDSQYVSMNPEAKIGPYILLQVEDTGMGMTPLTIEKVFDPFFTTKEIGKGTGLGLSTSLAIVKSHGGFIRIYSELGRGTSFKIYLPAQTDSANADVAASTSPLPRGHGELVLVVDDELSIRQITQQTLEAFGYRVVTATDGADAIAIYAVRREEIAIAVTDMMMPVLDGPATIQVLLKLNPLLPIIAVSGLSTTGQAAQAAQLGIKKFLPKPYTAEALLHALHDALPGHR